jgi:hypothetical protein
MVSLKKQTNEQNQTSNIDLLIIKLQGINKQEEHKFDKKKRQQVSIYK